LLNEEPLVRPNRFSAVQARIISISPQSVVDVARAHLRCVARTGGLAATALFLCACAPAPTKPAAAPPPPVNLSGYSTAFKEGFKDGCDSARGSARRDEKRFAADMQYAQGWQDGKAICGKRQ
jgi:hypothetical protein